VVFFPVTKRRACSPRCTAGWREAGREVTLRLSSLGLVTDLLLGEEVCVPGV
jgi:hypothetical protein